MNVMTMGDATYYPPMVVMAEQLEALHPDADFYVYDWGLSEEQSETLSSYDNSHVIPWEVPYELTTIERVIGFFEKVIKYDHFPTSRIAHRLMVSEDGYKTVWGPLRRRKEAYMKERIYCLLDCVELVDGPIVLLDADAIPLAPLDLLKEDFDIGVTLRPQDQIDEAKERRKYVTLNGGVVIFNTDPDSTRVFAEHWRDRAENCELELQEQTSLSRLVAEADSNLYDDYYTTGTLELDDVDLDVKVFPCDRWNYFYYDDIESVDPEENRILHMKSGRHSELDVAEIVDRIT